MDGEYRDLFVRNSVEFTQKTEKYVSQTSQCGVCLNIPCRSGIQKVYRHAGKSACSPTIFEIHGGCFSQGTSANDDRMRAEFNKQTGYQVFGLGYRKSTSAPFPAALDDVFDQIRYLLEHADQFQIDPDRIGIWGHSAGGNLACAAAWKGLEEGCYKASLLLLDYPYLDLYSPGTLRSSEKTGITANELDAMSAVYAPDGDRRDKYLSPVFASEEDLALLPPTSFIICGHDPLAAEDEMMLSRMLRAGVPVCAKKYPRMEHGFVELWYFREWYLKDTEICSEMEEDSMDALAYQARFAMSILNN